MNVGAGAVQRSQISPQRSDKFAKKAYAIIPGAKAGA